MACTAYYLGPVFFHKAACWSTICDANMAAGWALADYCLQRLKEDVQGSTAGPSCVECVKNIASAFVWHGMLKHLASKLAVVGCVCALHRWAQHSRHVVLACFWACGSHLTIVVVVWQRSYWRCIAM